MLATINFLQQQTHTLTSLATSGGALFESSFLSATLLTNIVIIASHSTTNKDVIKMSDVKTNNQLVMGHRNHHHHHLFISGSSAHITA